MSKSKEKCVLVVNNHGLSYYKPFRQFGPAMIDPRILNYAPEEVALVVFTGGEDVSPDLYGEEANDKTWANPHRDKIEKEVFERAVELKLPIVGICRGSQLICALSGGKLVQHVNNHGRYHNLRTDEGREVYVSSTHHQMQLPPKSAQVVAWADPRLSDVYEGPPGVQYEPEYEYDVVFYPNTNALGMQYHPEFMSSESEGFKYAGQLVERFFNLSVKQKK